MSITKRKNKEDAVSPVVGVMLMLVVTIIIAAVVAAFAGGLADTKEPASVSMLTLDSYTMKTIDQSKKTDCGENGEAVSATLKSGWFDYGIDEDGYSLKSSYAPYKMVFMHNGGEKLYVSDLKLAVTFMDATYSIPFKELTEKTTWVAGERLTLEVSTAKINDLKYDTANGKWSKNYVYGLSQQSMTAVSYPTYDWAILDASGNTISKGTAETLFAKQAASLNANKLEVTQGDEAKITFTVTSTAADGTSVKVEQKKDDAEAGTIGTTTLSNGKAIVEWQVDTSVAAGTYTIKATVGSVESEPVTVTVSEPATP